MQDYDLVQLKVANFFICLMIVIPQTEISIPANNITIETF